MVNTLASATSDSNLVGNWSWSVWLLIPLAVVLAVLTALALGGSGEDEPAPPRGGGVSRYLDRAGSAGTRTTDQEAR
jgi:hypothetical protein